MEEVKIQEIKNSILAEKANYEALNNIDTTSNTGVFNLIAYIVAKVAWSLRKLWEIFTMEFDQLVREQKIGTTLWYSQQALKFRFGHPLSLETLEYEDTGYTPEQIQESLIIKRVAVIELELNNRKELFIKLAKEVDNDLSKLEPQEIEAVEQYFAKKKFAGTKIVIFSENADDLRLTVNFEYDPLIFDENGTRTDGTGNTNVQDAIRNYLVNLKFNGEFIIAELETALRAIEGCVDREAYVVSAERNFKTPEDWEIIDSSIVANSGYMRISEENLTINFIPKADIL